MATWGMREIKINKFTPESTLYYSYSTTADVFFFETVENEDHGLGNERYVNQYRFGLDTVEAIMEAFIFHLLAFKCSGNVEKFVERYIKNNRFHDAKVKKKD